MPTNSTEEELMKYKNKENFALFCISWLFNSNFGRKPRRSYTFILFSLTRSQLTATLVAPAPQNLPSTTFGSSDPATTNKLLYSTYILGTKPIPKAYMQSPGIKSTHGVYMQFLSIESPLAVYI